MQTWRTRRAEQPRRVNQGNWVSDHSPEDSKACCVCIQKFPRGFHRVMLERSI